MEELVMGLELDYDQWTETLTGNFGLQRYRADQICQWIYQKKVFDFQEMTNLSKELRGKLADAVMVAPPILTREETSKDGTKKYLWQFHDGERVESVLLTQEGRLTACLSTQVGCPLACTFCASGQGGFVRDLSAGEIVGQFLAMENLAGRDIDNVVYMGMGEPFLNQESVFKSIKILNEPKMRGLGIRRITISTAGIVPGILALAE
ncbi:radical SAM protein, partial [Acetomicrobium hydrogeniformans]